MSDKRAKLVIVDDHLIVLEGLQKLLQNAANITVEGTFTTGAAFLTFLEQHSVDIVLLDISLPDTNGIDLCREIKKLSPATIVLALSNHNERSMVLQMLQQGASGYLLKNIAGDELIVCIQEALNGEMTFSQAVKEIMSRPSVAELKGIPRLTKREKEILQLIAEGQTTPDIAATLHLSPLTVETHRKSLLQKFEVKNVALLIRMAVEHKLL
ncbi:response regulator transcription factor [Chitinophaga rhizophila]|uniref:Response regulator transcription factor n=1 Tax=Chitinophaga rhizophila TaxID=2866212 RepID=A0ABS7G965_9BACT|nr:response regulator transcription factor [Chitinophaga rhizophila]MBW8683850.1 response regulator transcription factor [Chitinophaga rhizophila]